MVLYHNEECPEDMFKLDVWHNFHGGSGKNFLASSYVELLPTFDGNSIDARFESMGANFDTWRKTKNMKFYAGTISRGTFGASDLQVCPDGCWSKFDDTRVLKLG